jgi:hypothetical protein
MTITFGAWLLPATITFVAIVAVIVAAGRSNRGGGMMDFDLSGFLVMVVATAAVVGTWIGYAIGVIAS